MTDKDTLSTGLRLGITRLVKLYLGHPKNARGA